MGKKKSKTPSNIIAQNKKARHDFSLEREFEAGLVLEGWEVKSIRAGNIGCDMTSHTGISDGFLSPILLIKLPFQQDGSSVLISKQSWCRQRRLWCQVINEQIATKLQ